MFLTPSRCPECNGPVTAVMARVYQLAKVEADTTDDGMLEYRYAAEPWETVGEGLDTDRADRVGVRCSNGHVWKATAAAAPCRTWKP